MTYPYKKKMTWH